MFHKSIECSINSWNVPFGDWIECSMVDDVKRCFKILGIDDNKLTLNKLNKHIIPEVIDASSLSVKIVNFLINYFYKDIN